MWVLQTKEVPLKFRKKEHVEHLHTSMQTFLSDHSWLPWLAQVDSRPALVSPHLGIAQESGSLSPQTTETFWISGGWEKYFKRCELPHRPECSEVAIQ